MTEDKIPTDSGSVALPQPDEVDNRDKQDAFGAYIMMFAGMYFPLPFIEIIASLIYYRYYRFRSRYTAFHSYQSLMGQIPVSVFNVFWFIYLIVFIVIAEERGATFSYNPVFIGTFIFSIVLLLTLNIYYFVISITAAVKAQKGHFYYFPVVGKKAFEKFYGSNAVDVSMDSMTRHKNVPPS